MIYIELKHYKFQCQNDSGTSNCVKMTVRKIIGNKIIDSSWYVSEQYSTFHDTFLQDARQVILQNKQTYVAHLCNRN